MVIGILFGLPGLIANALSGRHFILSTTGQSAGFQAEMESSRFSLLSVIAFWILGVAQIHVYLTMVRSRMPVLFNTFLDGLTLWFRALKSALWYFLWVILWSCLFVIPGIVKMISYSQMFFIITEHPHIKIRQAMQISKIMTQGHKADLFVMCLSFVGWYIVCGITCGIGLLWLTPYMNMAFANAYAGIKQDALNRGVLVMQDFI